LGASLYYLGGEYCGILARSVAVACHFANAFLVYHILRRIFIVDSLAVWIAAIYMLSPCYYMRSYFIQFFFDFYLAWYLLSVYLISLRGTRSYIAAIVCFIISLGFETLMFLEPVRLLFVYSLRRDLKTTARVCMPFWIVTVVFVLVRLTWLQPYGYYEGYNEISLRVSTILTTLAATWWGYLCSAWFTVVSAYKLAGWYGITFLAGLLLASVWWMDRRGWTIFDTGTPQVAVTVQRIMFALILTVSGSLPYLLIRRCSIAYSQTSRFAYVSVLGISVALATLTAAIPNRAVRTYCFLSLLVLLALCTLQVNKWFLYEAMVNRDMIMRLGSLLSRYPHDPPLVILKLVPEKSDVRALRRHLSIYDLNVPLNLIRDESWAKVFVHHDAKGPPPPDCGIVGYKRQPCPEKRLVVEYRLNPDRDCVEKMSYWDLIKAVFDVYSEPPGMGVLGIVGDRDPRNRPNRRFETKEPSLREGGARALKILGIEPTVVGVHPSTGGF
jgi:hypothetical protein